MSRIVIEVWGEDRSMCREIIKIDKPLVAKEVRVMTDYVCETVSKSAPKWAEQSQKQQK